VLSSAWNFNGQLKGQGKMAQSAKMCFRRSLGHLYLRAMYSHAPYTLYRQQSVMRAPKRTAMQLYACATYFIVVAEQIWVTCKLCVMHNAQNSKVQNVHRSKIYLLCFEVKVTRPFTRRNELDIKLVAAPHDEQH
jgi:hypothetical protein